MSLCPRVRLSVCLRVRVSACPYVPMSVCPYVRMPACPYVRVSVCPLVRMSACPCVCVRVSACPSQHAIPVLSPDTQGVSLSAQVCWCVSSRYLKVPTGSVIASNCVFSGYEANLVVEKIVGEDKVQPQLHLALSGAMCVPDCRPSALSGAMCVPDCRPSALSGAMCVPDYRPSGPGFVLLCFTSRVLED